MKQFPLGLTNQEHSILKITAAKQNKPMREIIIEATRQSMWHNYGVLWPDYEPDECPYCNAPISEHTYIPPSDTEPGSYECPTDDEITF